MLGKPKIWTTREGNSIAMKVGLGPKLRLASFLLLVGVISWWSQVEPAGAVPSTAQGCYGSYYTHYYAYYPYYYMYPYYCYYGYYGYSGYPYTYPYYYQSQPSKYQLTMSTDPPELATVSGTGSYGQGSSASFSVTRSTIDISPNTRYVFSHWSGDFAGVGTSGTLTMNGARKVVATYQLQYYLDTGVSPQTAPLPEGEGWYNANDTVIVAVDSAMIGGGGGEASRLVFEGWNVDGNGVPTSSPLTLKMDSPHVVSAQYKQQYRLKVLTDQGIPYGEGWYDEGATVRIYISTPASRRYGVNLVFNGWQGDIQSNDPSTSVIMDKPKTIIASWRTDATVLYLTIALVIFAAAVVGGILAYAALTKRRAGRETEEPTSQLPPSTDTERKMSSVSRRKKSQPTKTDVPESTS